MFGLGCVTGARHFYKRLLVEADDDNDGIVSAAEFRRFVGSLPTRLMHWGGLDEVSAGGDMWRGRRA